MMSKKLGKALLAILLVLLLGAVWLGSRPGMREVGIEYAQPAVSSSGLKVRWLGVATLLFDDGETQIMTDGFVSRPTLLDMLFERPIEPDREAIAAVIEAHGVNRLAAIMPVHSHYDHAMDTADFALLTGADVLGSNSTANIARSSKLPESQIRVIEPGVPYIYGRFTITFFESAHVPLPEGIDIGGVVEQPFDLPAPYTAWQLGKSYSIHIAHPEGSALVQGSAGYVAGALAGVEADTVFLGTGGLKNQPADYVSAYIGETVHAVDPARVYIIHQDDLIGTFGDVEQNKLMLTFDTRFAFDLLQAVLPARLLQLQFGTDVSVAAGADRAKQ